MRPVILIGKGAECAELAGVLELGVPVLTSWQAIDLLDNDHSLNYGRPGVYGQRCANRVLAEADQVLSIGCRCSVWCVGYTFNPPVHLMVDIDMAETDRFPRADARNVSAAEFIRTLVPYPADVGGAWIEQCDAWRAAFPWVEGKDMYGTYIDPYHFIDRLSKYFKADQIITTDTGTPYVVAHQILKIKRPQRLIASGGLSDAPDVLGEIVVRAPHQKDRYDRLWGTQRASAREPGWHRTGDVGHLDTQGRLWIGGRLAHVITTLEGPVSPVGIEQAVQWVPSVVQAAVVGVGPVGTQQIVVIVVTDKARTGLAGLDLIDAVRGTVTRDVAAVLERKELPVDIRHNSKIDRGALAAWASELLAGRSSGGSR